MNIRWFAFSIFEIMQVWPTFSQVGHLAGHALNIFHSK